MCELQQIFVFPGSIRGPSMMAIFWPLTPTKSGFFHPKEIEMPPLTHTPHLLTRAHQKCYFRIVLAEVRGLGMQRHRVSQLGQRDSCSNTAISTQLQGQKTAFSISWWGKPSLPKKTLLTTQYLKTGFARKPSQRTFRSEYLKPWC